jgi:hypothetical protein
MIALPKRSGSASASSRANPGRPRAGAARERHRRDGAPHRQLDRRDVEAELAELLVELERDDAALVLEDRADELPHSWTRASATSVSAIAAPPARWRSLPEILLSAIGETAGSGRKRIEELEPIEGRAGA